MTSMEQEKKPAGRTGKILKLLLKLVVPVLCLWFVSGKIDWTSAREAFRSANPFWLGLAALAFVLSKIFAAIRLHIYFSDINVPIDQSSNLRLYWLGMFYNLFLPGAISGDAYKTILLKQWFQTPFKKSGAAVLLDRISGMVALVILLAVYGMLVLPERWQMILLLLGAMGASLALYAVVRWWMRDFRRSFASTLLWGLAVQGMQVVCIYAVMQALDIAASESGYLFLFLLSSIASVLPLTIGGLGIREIVFLQGSALLLLPESKAVVISLIFYLITLLCSLPGYLYTFRSPLQKNSPAKEPG